MPNGGQPYPYFSIVAKAVPQLRQHQRREWVFFAEAYIQLGVKQGSRRRMSPRLAVRLDSGAFVSLLPQDWVTHLTEAGFPLRCSGQLSFQTAAGQGEGTFLDAEVDTVFATDPHQQAYHFDWLVTPNLNGRGYGLVALRDLIPRFFIRAEGLFELGPNDEPLALPTLELIPRQVWDRVRYHCPVCQIVAWGRSGLHLICGDNNIRLIQV